MRLEAKQSGGIGKHWPRIGPREALALEELEKDFTMTTSQVRIGAALRRRITEVTPALDDLLGGTPADPELESPIADEIRRAGILDHVEGILVPHVDHGRPDFYTVRSRADGREKREGRRERL